MAQFFCQQFSRFCSRCHILATILMNDAAIESIQTYLRKSCSALAPKNVGEIGLCHPLDGITNP
jgi:hypothetical protein